MSGGDPSACSFAPARDKEVEGRRRAGCQIAVEFKDPDGNNLEIYWSIDRVGTDGAVRPPSEWRPARTLEDAVANPVAGQRLPPVSDIG